jgi:hypothetical protein
MRIMCHLPVIAHGRLPRHQIAKYVAGYVEVEIDLDEYAAVEVPVVLSSETFVKRSGGNGFDVKRQQFHGVDGRFFMKTGRGTQDGPVAAVISRDGSGAHPFLKPATDAVREIVRWAKDNDNTKSIHPEALLRSVTGYTSVTDTSLEPLASYALKDIDQAGIDKQIEDFKVHASRFILVDGAYMIDTAEPVFVVKEAFGNTLETSILFRPDFEPIVDQDNEGRQIHAKVGYFPLTDSARLASAVETASGYYPNGALTRDLVQSVEIHDGSFFSTDCEALSVYEAAVNMRQRFALRMSPPETHDEKSRTLETRKRLSALDPFDFELFRDLVRGIDESSEQAISPLLESVVTGIANRDRNSPSQSLFVEGGKPMEFLLEALSRWENRTVGLSLDDDSPRLF